MLRDCFAERPCTGIDPFKIFVPKLYDTRTPMSDDWGEAARGAQ